MYNDIVIEDNGSVEYYGSEPNTIENDDYNEESENGVVEDLELVDPDSQEAELKEEFVEDPVEVIEKIDNKNDELKEDIEEIKNVLDDLTKVRMDDSSSSVYSKSVSSNELAIVSDNIIDKQLVNYNVQESLLAMILLSLIVAGIVIMIKRSLIKWR